MGKSPGKSCSNKIINYKDKGEVAQWATNCESCKALIQAFDSWLYMFPNL